MRTSSCWVFAVFLVLPACGALLGQDYEAKNFLRVNEDFCTAGQPTKGDLAKLKESGVRTILNLRRPEENPSEQEEEKKLAEALGLNYVVIPINVADIKPSQVDQFLATVRNEANRPLFIHCHSANRVGAFWMIHRVLSDGWDSEKAEQEARKIGLTRPELIEFAHKYLEQHKAEPTKQ